ncbi:MAG: hypothetical protein MHPSP_004625, partial [Paramarteilia canceri]
MQLNFKNLLQLHLLLLLAALESPLKSEGRILVEKVYRRKSGAKPLMAGWAL